MGKVVLISNGFESNPGDDTSDKYYNCLTIGKAYDVIKTKDSNFNQIRKTYLIKNDNGYVYLYGKEFFKELDVLRNEKLNKLLSDDC